MEIKDLAGISKPLKKLIEVVESAIGSFFLPIQNKRIAKSDAERIHLVSEAIKECSDLPIKYEKDGIVIGTLDPNVMNSSVQRMLFQEYIKELNIESVVSNAYEILSTTQNVSDEPVDNSWTNYFFDSVAYISNTELQNIWAKILSAEIVSPKSISVRTLDVMHNVSVQEARLFERVSQYILYAEDHKNSVTDFFILNNSKVFNYMKITFPDIVKLMDSGLMMSGTNLVEEFDLSGEGTEKIYAGQKCVIELQKSKDNETILMNEIYVLSTAGCEIYNAVYKEKMIDYDDEYYKLCKNLILKNN